MPKPVPDCRPLAYEAAARLKVVGCRLVNTTKGIAAQSASPRIPHPERLALSGAIKLKG